MTLKLVIGNKNYSSWSMRPWLALRANKIAFEEIFIPLYTGAADKQRILELYAVGQGAGADRWRRHGLGFAVHHRICRREVSASAAVAYRPGGAGACAFDLGGDAFGLPGAAQRVRHEPAPPSRRHRAVGGCARQYRPHPGNLDRVPRALRHARAIPVRILQRCGRDVCARGASLSDLCHRGGAPGAPIHGGDDGPCRPSRIGPVPALPRPSG